jgi:aspartate 1-decarboxylase
MILTMMKAKLHNATVTQADLNYQGSIAIDPDLLAEAGILPLEQVHVYNVSNGARFVTYAIDGKSGSREICVNGAAARLAAPGDRVIVVSYAQMDEKEAKAHRARVLILGPENRILPQ